MFQCCGEGTDVRHYCTQYAHFATASNRVTSTSTRSLHVICELRAHAASCSHWAVNPTLLARVHVPRSRPMRDARLLNIYMSAHSVTSQPWPCERNHFGARYARAGPTERAPLHSPCKRQPRLTAQTRRSADARCVALAISTKPEL